MRTTSFRRRAALWAPWAALAVAVLYGLPRGLAEGDISSLEANRRLLEKWRGDPAHYARLEQDLRAFLELPPERQEHLRKLDHDLHAEESAVQSRLWRALERYAAWLDRQPPDQRQRIDAAANGVERRRAIREIRQQQWLDRLPEAVQRRLKKLPDDERTREIARLQAEEKRQRQQWQLAIAHWDDLIQPKRPPLARLEQFPVEVRNFVENVLTPLLTDEERRDLKAAENQWPLYPRTLVRLADNHPVLAPGAPHVVRRIDDLPVELRDRLTKLKNWPPPFVTKAEGKWPEFAIAVANLVRKRKAGPLPRQFFPARPAEFPAPIRAFLANRLEPALTADERTRYDAAKGLWPEFPRLVLFLAREHNLPGPPGMVLPGQREQWDRFRGRLAAPAVLLDVPEPEVPLRTLQQFFDDLTPAERVELRLSPMDPMMKERLVEEWKKRRATDWQQLQQADRQKRLRKVLSQN
jgi:hypothetical protein